MGKTVVGVVSPAHASEGAARELFQWNGHGSPEDPATATIWFASGYGEQPYFRLRKIDGAWTLTAFGTEDLGEP